jgi:multidrug resistance protein
MEASGMKPTGSTRRSQPSARAVADLDRPARPWFALGGLLVGTFLGTANNNIVNVPLRQILADFDAPISRGALVVIGFLMPFAVAMPIMGWLGDRWGRRRLYCFALAGLAVGAVGAASAPTLEVLVACRVLQGLATAAVLPTVMGLIAQIFEPARRGRALGAWASVNGLGQAVGPPLGGLIADWFTWRWIFVLIASLTGVALLMVMRAVPADRPRPIALEWRGAMALTSGAAFLIAAVTATAQPDLPFWLAPLLAVAGVAAIGVLVVVERRVEKPFVPLRLISESRFMRSSLAAFSQMFCLGTTLLAVPLYLTGEAQLSATVAGLVTFALPAAMAVLAPVAGLLTERRPRVVIRCGLLALVVAQLLLAVVLAAGVIRPFEIVAILLVAGTGVAMVQTPSAAGATRSPAGRAGAGLGLFNLIRFAGSAVGAAWVAIVLRHEASFLVMFGISAAVAGVGLFGTFLGADPTPDATSSEEPPGPPSS